MKNGFTLIEIIISITLVLLIGASATLFIINENNDINDLSSIILQSAKTYLETEIDDNGNTYKEGLFKGGNGVVIPLHDLNDGGYLSEEIIKSLEDSSISLNEYILAGVFSDSKDYCTDSDSIIEFQTSWDSELKKISETSYICEYGSNNEGLEVDVNFQIDLNKTAVSKSFYDGLTLTGKDQYFTFNENGDYLFYDDDEETLYKYYRGAVDNNYVEFGEKDGTKLKWRIVWLKDNNEAENDGFDEMKLVLDDVVPIFLETTNGSKINIELGDEFHYLASLSNKYCYFIMSAEGAENLKDNLKSTGDYNDYSMELVGNSKYYYCSNDGTVKKSVNLTYNVDLFQSIFFSVPFDNDNNVYTIQLLNWYNSTNLPNYNTTSENYLLENHCYNHYPSLDYKDSDFNCKDIGKSSRHVFNRTISTLTKADILHAGVSSNSKGIYSDNYLINDEKTSIVFLHTTDYDYYSGLSHSLTGGGSGPGNFSGSTLLGQGYNSLKLDLTINGSSVFPARMLKSNYEMNTLIFFANSIKPSIIVDLTKLKVGNEKGTSSNPYTLTAK